MTTPATPERPERMTEERIAVVIGLIVDTLAGHSEDVSALLALSAELRRARAHEEDGWKLADALAHETSLQIEARLKAEAERDAAQTESAGRLKALEEKAEEARREWKRAENAEAARDAAREEAERLRGFLPRMRAELTEALLNTSPRASAYAPLASIAALINEAKHANK